MGGQGEKDPPDPPDKNKKTSKSSSSSTNTLTEDGMVDGAVGGVGGGVVGGAIGGEERKSFGGARSKTSGGGDGHYDRIWPKNSTNMTSAKGQDKSRGSVTEANGPDRRDSLKRRYAQIIAEAEEVAKRRQTLILKLNKEQDPEDS